MKNNRQENLPNKQNVGNQTRPQNKDDLDSRINEEQDTKGNDVTHNEKETKRDHLKKKDK